VAIILSLNDGPQGKNMVSVSENKAIWDGDYRWQEAGDEWSAAWGSVPMQWYGTLMPRIHRYLPAGNILEIACGHGRWTQFLRNHCEQLVGVDLSKQCIDACKTRFAGDSRLRFVQNDGKSLDMIADESVDFIFSFDSLVHVDLTILGAYLAQFRRVLKQNGTAFIHHSNNGECPPYHPRRIPKVRGVLRMMHVLEFHHLRDLSVSAAKVEGEARKHGLACAGQEINTWLTSRTLIDCFSTIVRSDSVPAVGANVVIRNRDFLKEARGWSRLSGMYS
jgi:ubiquinone/menaquinone biosynthesis C-methylase UbiE